MAIGRKIIEEVSMGRRSVYKIPEIDEFNQVIGEPVLITCPLYFVHKGDILYILPHDNNMLVISDEYRFLNYHHRHEQENTRRTLARALRFYNCFKAIHNISDDVLSSDRIDMLVAFLCGYDYEPKTWRLNSTRDAATVNNYLSAIRTYLEYIGKPCPFLESTRTRTSVTEYEGFRVTREHKQYKFIVEPDPHKNDYAPEHILPEDFVRLRNIALSRNDNQAFILIYLMYICGLRLGECLSLTTEDIIFMQVGETLKPFIVLRKRIGEKKWASPKNIHPVERRKDYGTKKEKKVLIPITDDIYRALAAFIADEMKMVKERFPSKRSALQADICNPAEFEGEKNYYIFINHNRGTRLDDQSWGRTLKKMFLEAGLVLDKDNRDLNLSHRLRHGCAMLYYRYIDEEHRLSLDEVRKIMRHSNIKTTMVYTKPTLADSVMVREQFQSDLFKICPYLK